MKYTVQQSLSGSAPRIHWFQDSLSSGTSLSRPDSLPFTANIGGEQQREVIRMSVYREYMCVVCGFVYSEEAGLPEEGFAPGTRWADIPDSWVCPECGAAKEDFEMIEV